MHRRLLIQLTLLAVLNMAVCLDAVAEDARLTADARTIVDQSPYPDRWCALRFARSASAGRTSPRLLTSSRSSTTNEPFPPSLVQETRLVDSLIALRRFRIATLWRGRERKLVLGLVDAGYLGVRLEQASESR